MEIHDSGFSDLFSAGINRNQFKRGGMGVVVWTTTRG
jgi:hypothetical protein